MKKNYPEALKQFISVVDLCDDNPDNDNTASVLKYLEFVDGEIKISETKEGDFFIIIPNFNGS